MEVLKIATAGSVDDGKSTLIGRILYDTKSLTDDKLESIKKNSQQKGYDYLDFSLATDGLVAEREQGITIDVAHIYFSTPNRRYIIADTPGHVEYTRNMVTGASTSQVAIILIDARHGVIEQTARHFFINHLLRVKDVIIAVNKMDLVGFSQNKFEAIKTEVLALSETGDYKAQRLTFIPVCALHGDNVVKPSIKTPWYKGETLLEHLEKIDGEDVYDSAQTRLPIQMIIRPKSNQFHDFRGYAGKVYGGSFEVGDSITVMPSQTTSSIKSIQFFNQSFDKVEQGNSVTITLNDDVNICRGDMLVKSSELPKVSNTISATVCWMDHQPLQLTTKYILKHGPNAVLAKVEDLNSHTFEGADVSIDSKLNELTVNQIGKVKLKLNKTLFFDSYHVNKSNGAFILIDPQTNATAGVGFIN